MAKYDITQQEFSERLSYDPITGYIIWIAKGNSKKVIIGKKNKKYIYFSNFEIK